MHSRAGTEVKFFNSDCIANVQRERAESARLALELQQARQINVQLEDLQQQQIGQARQQSNGLLQVLSRAILHDIIALLSLSHSHSHSLHPTRTSSFSLICIRPPPFPSTPSRHCCLFGCIACFGHWTLCLFHSLILSLSLNPPCLCLVPFVLELLVA